MRIAITAAAALPLVLLAGCTTGKSAPAPAPSHTAAVVVSHASQSLTAGLVLPIQSYLIPTTDVINYYNATRILASKCMRGHGFAGDPYAAHVASAEPIEYTFGTNMPRRYGIADFGVAAEYGYHLPPAWTPATAQDPTVSQAETQILVGCMGVAAGELGGNLDDQAAEKIDDDSLAQSQQDPAVRAAIAAWSRCMAGSGYHFSTPYDTTSGLGPSFGGPSEVRMATIDIACKRQTNLVQVWFKTETGLQNQAIVAQRGQLDAQDRINKAILDAANKLTEG